jgi:hypothetical protein
MAFSLVVVLLLSIWEVVSSSPARAGCVKPKTFKIGNDFPFVKSTAFRSENHGFFGYNLKHGGPGVPVGVARERTLTAKMPQVLTARCVRAKHRSKFAALSPVMVTVAR